VNPAARLSAALLSALVLWWPTLSATMRGELGLAEGALRYLAAFLFARLAVEGLVLLFRHYAPPVEDDEVDHVDEGMSSAGAS
jgi:hypothetical protein